MNLPHDWMKKNRIAGRIAIPLAFIITLLAGLALAYYLGKVAGAGNYKKIIAFIAVSSAVIICLKLKTKLWLLIPFTWPLTGAVGGLNLPFGLNELVVLGVFGMFVVFYALKVPIRKASYNSLDILLFVNLAWLITVFIRNPAGVEALGSDRVGGRPYFVVIIAFLAYWIFHHVTIESKMVRTFPALMIGGTFIMAVLGVVTKYVPGLAFAIAPIYSGVNTSTAIREEFGGLNQAKVEVDRQSELGSLGAVINLYFVSLFGPSRILNPAHIFRFLLFVGAWAGIALSGFRGAIVYNGVYLLLAAYFYSGMRDVVKLLFIGLCALLIISLGHGNVFEFPASVQRSLSWLPAKWTSQEAVNDAKGSTEWRIELWREAIRNKDVIPDWWFGTGFGFSARDLQIQYGSIMGMGGYNDGTSAQMVTGAFHNGPLSTIRYAGLVGLALFLALMFYASFYAWKLVQRTKGTPLFGLAIFAALPIIYYPIPFLTVFGAYDSGLPATIFSIGLLRLVDHSLGVHLAKVTAEKVTTHALPAAPIRRFGEPVFSR